MTGEDGRAGARLEVRLDRRTLDRIRRVGVIANALSLALLVVLFGAGGVLVALSDESLAPFLFFFALLAVILLLQCFQLWWFVTDWRRTRAIEVPVELDDDGVVLRSPFGDVRCPWEAVREVSLEGRRTGAVLRVRCAPPSERPGPSEVRWDIDSARKRKLVAAQGMRYAMRILQVEPDRLAWAVWHHSGDRVRVVRR